MSIESLLSFPKSLPTITCGEYSREENILYTGHVNGLVLKWDVASGEYTKIISADSDVRTLSLSDSGDLAIGYRSGAFFIIDTTTLTIKHSKTPIESRFNRIWNSVWSDNNNIILTSTYGRIRHIELDNYQISKEEYLRGHIHSIFAIDQYNGYIITGDWNGDVILWEYEDSEYTKIQKLGVIGTVQDVCWNNVDSFALICDNGKVYYYERLKEEEKTWREVVKIDIATRNGVCIELTDDTNAVYAGTKNNIIQYDIISNLTKEIDVTSSVDIYSHADAVFVLTEHGFFHFKYAEIEIEDELIRYKYTKIGLLGHTGTGKTTFSNWISDGELGDIHSTFGKKIRNWDLPDDGSGILRKIIFHDHGGQETVIETFLPLIKDVDIILLFYKQVDKLTFIKARRLYDLIKRDLPSNIQVYFVQTFIDNELNELLGIPLETLIENGDIPEIIPVSPITNRGKQFFEDKVINSIDWENAKLTIESPFTRGLNEVILEISQMGYPSYTYEAFKARVEEKIGGSITHAHLNFLLNDYTNHGVIEYYPQILDRIIFNEESLNNLRSNVPIYISSKKGFIRISELIDIFGDNEYVRILDELYNRYHISIPSNGVRIFPMFLKDDILDIPDIYLDNIKEASLKVLKIPYRDMDLYNLISYLTDIKMECLGINKNQGFFSWELNAYIYYEISKEKSLFQDKYIKITYGIAGSDIKIQKRLNDEFVNIIDSMYGPILE